MDVWPPPLLELADRALRENGGALVGNHGNLAAAEGVTVNIARLDGRIPLSPGTPTPASYLAAGRP